MVFIGQLVPYFEGRYLAEVMVRLRTTWPDGIVEEALKIVDVFLKYGRLSSAIPVA